MIILCVVFAWSAVQIVLTASITRCHVVCCLEQLHYYISSLCYTNTRNTWIDSQLHVGFIVVEICSFSARAATYFQQNLCNVVDMVIEEPVKSFKPCTCTDCWHTLCNIKWYLIIIKQKMVLFTPFISVWNEMKIQTWISEKSIEHKWNVNCGLCVTKVCLFKRGPKNI